MQSNPTKILVCQLRQIGDVLLATPAIHLLKHRFPQAELHVLTERKCAAVLENNPYVDHVWEIDKKALSNVITAVRWYWMVAHQGFDLIVDFQQLPRCKWVVGFSPAPIKLSFTPPWYNAFLYTHTADMRPGYAGRAKASILAPLGIEWDGERPELFLTGEERRRADDFLAAEGLSDGLFITVDPSHRRQTRRWPAGHFVGLFRLLEKRYPGLKIVVLYGPGEKTLAEEIAGQSPANAVVPSKMLTLREMAAVMERAVLHFGNCSSPRHFAVAVDTPSVTIQGATSAAWRFPGERHLSLIRTEGCHTCNRNTCKLGTYECLNEYRPERVLAEFGPFLEKCLAQRDTRGHGGDGDDRRE